MKDLKDISSSQLSFDICIVGAGAAGITIAHELVDSSLVIGVFDGGDEVYTNESQLLYAAQTPPDTYEDITYNRLRFYGGSTNHWQNSTAPFIPLDFENREWIPDSEWPIKFKDIEPYYKKAGIYCGVNGDGYDLNDLLSTTKLNDPFKKTKNLRSKVTKTAELPTRFFAAHGTKLLQASNINLYKNANIVSVDFDEKSQTVTSAIFTCTTSNRQVKVFANKFIFCMGGIENARLLLNINEDWDNKLGNRYDNVGRYFMDHPMLRLANFYPNSINDYKLYDKRVINGAAVRTFLSFSEQFCRRNKINNLRLPLHKATELSLSTGIKSLVSIRDSLNSDKPLPNSLHSHIWNILKDTDLVIESLYSKSFSEKLFDSPYQESGFDIPMMVEQSPDRNNRIKLGTERDRLGLKKVLVDWKLTIQDRNNIWRSLQLLAEQVGSEDLGRLRVLEEFEPEIIDKRLYFGHHHMGTTRMSFDERTGVVDKNLRVFGTNNLYMAGSSTFRTGGHVPPTLTIVALSIRLAKQLRDI